VRTAAAARCAELPPELRLALPEPRFAVALAEYVVTQRYMSDLPSGPYNLANLDANLGRYDDAERAYRRAIAIDDRFTPAKVNLATLLAARRRVADAEVLLRSVRADDAGYADALFDLALLLADSGRTTEAARTVEALLARDPTYEARVRAAQLGR